MIHIWKSSRTLTLLLLTAAVLIILFMAGEDAEGRTITVDDDGGRITRRYGMPSMRRRKVTRSMFGKASITRM